MKIYLAGIIAGHDDFISWEQKERQCFEEMGLIHRLCSYHFIDILEGYLMFRKTYKNKLKEG